MEIVTEYDSVLRNLTTRALYYSKFEQNYQSLLMYLGFEEKDYIPSGHNSWEGNRFYDPNLGANVANFHQRQQIQLWEQANMVKYGMK